MSICPVWPPLNIFGHVGLDRKFLVHFLLVFCECRFTKPKNWLFWKFQNFTESGPWGGGVERGGQGQVQDLLRGGHTGQIVACQFWVLTHGFNPMLLEAAIDFAQEKHLTRYFLTRVNDASYKCASVATPSGFLIFTAERCLACVWFSGRDWGSIPVQKFSGNKVDVQHLSSPAHRAE